MWDNQIIFTVHFIKNLNSSIQLWQVPFLLFSQSRKLCKWEFRTSQKSGYIRNNKPVSYCQLFNHFSVVLVLKMCIILISVIFIELLKLLISEVVAWILMYVYFFSPSSLIGQLQKLQSLIAAKVPRAVTARSTQTSTCLMVSIRLQGTVCFEQRLY